MASVALADSRFLNSLIQDCITFNLGMYEGLEYVKTRYGKPISTSAYQVRKAKILSDDSTNVWLNNFTRIGFVKNHQQDIDVIRKLREDSMRQLLIETIKPQGNRGEYKILRLKHDIRENTQLLSELNLGTPIISAIKAKLDMANKQNVRNTNTQTIQVCQ